MSISITKNCVLLLKSEGSDGESDKYKELLVANNFEVIQVKTLVFQYKNIDILREKLAKPDDFSGLILSSPRCVNAVQQSMGNENLSKQWRSKSNYTVGPRTHSEALDKLGIDCKGKESGNAKNLAQMIVQEPLDHTDKPFLFPHGNLKTDTLKIELGKENIKMEEVLVYDTLPNPNLGEELEKTIEKYSIPEFVVFFSPSGLHSSLPYLAQATNCLDLAKIIAIGPVTRLAIEEENLKVYNVAKSPTPESVLESIM